ncbi:ech hydrogenase subunit B [Faecalicoccus acidiformans]|uniref:Ech hydrogenase subunit B n=1 Tax=Faecalicoccus acidiformans TaxID=915173 RepID=A0A7W8FXY6_9FIRM|nr:complex I subunit 1 family protein [Faecalicoccus acidiformans]MBB5184856.1 ech hydrogenase subunit B [Faecalicoccus acidiformans]MBM6831268.1 NADH-quinone oxidoreductase subunit H [Faecalicoccus acidiformans]MDM8203276.1 NADH-quinone oxidoreductase subunit H [Faecalicoccus acidiformans]
MSRTISLILYLVLAPFIGALLDGVDRKITARMQGRKGPSLFQPFYDLVKLFSKQMIAVNSVQLLLNCSYLVFLAIAGGMVFFGTDILMSLFILSTADMFLILAASSDSSPYSNIGASREMLQMMSYEPMTLLIAVGFYLATGSFRVDEIILQSSAAIWMMPGLFVGFILIMAIKLRKSPFDLSTSHHAHQEVVKGITTEMSGPTLAIMEIGEYYEKMLLLAIVGLFFIHDTAWSWIIGIVACLGVYFIEILIDNVCARVNWKKLIEICWLITLLCGGINILILMLI